MNSIIRATIRWFDDSPLVLSIGMDARDMWKRPRRPPNFLLDNFGTSYVG